MMFGNQLYELAQIREQEYMHEAELRRGSRGRSRRHSTAILTGTARRLRRAGMSTQQD